MTYLVLALCCCLVACSDTHYTHNIEEIIHEHDAGPVLLSCPEIESVTCEVVPPEVQVIEVACPPLATTVECTCEVPETQVRVVELRHEGPSTELLNAQLLTIRQLSDRVSRLLVIARRCEPDAG